MRKIYLVKKNPELPADGSNWIVMNSYEFMNFVQSPDGQKRRENFGQLDACSVDDVIIIAECGTETAKRWRAEKDRHDYLVSIEKQSGMTVFSYNTQTTTEDEMSGERRVKEHAENRRQRQNVTDGNALRVFGDFDDVVVVVGDGDETGFRFRRLFGRGSLFSFLRSSGGRGLFRFINIRLLCWILSWILL